MAYNLPMPTNSTPSEAIHRPFPPKLLGPFRRVGYVRGLILASTLLLLVSPAGNAQGPKPRIELEVLTTGNAAAGNIRAAHEWMAILKSLDLDRVSMRQSDEALEPTIEKVGTGKATRLRVTGRLDQRGQLRLPGATFGKLDKSRLSQWLRSIDQVQQSNDGGLAFGLDADQLVSLTERLESPINRATQGQSVREVFKSIRSAARVEITLTSRAKRRLSQASARNDVFDDELNGLSTGTSLAAFLRPYGLVAVPEVEDESSEFPRLVVYDVRDAEQTWPVGWPRDTQPHKLVPKLHEFLEVEIDEVPIADVLHSIQGRLEIPFLHDHNGMARKQIDPATTLVSYPAKKTFYSKMIKNVLFQAKLKYEMRVDEAGHPFLWISPR